MSFGSSVVNVVAAENKDNHFTTHTEDVTKSYAYKTAKENNL